MTNTSNTNVTFKGSKLTLTGPSLQIGGQLPRFVLSGSDLGDLSSDTFKGKTLLISCVPSLDTPVCSIQTNRFDQTAEKLSDRLSVLTVSLDLPFAQARWCGAQNASKIIVASDYKYRTFGKAFGVFIEQLGLLSRAVFVADRLGKISYLEYVPEITNEPDYDAAMAVVSKLIESR